MLGTIALVTAVTAGVASIPFAWYKATQKINAEYGFKVIDNLEDIKTAMNHRDYQRVKQLFKERDNLVNGMHAQFDGYSLFTTPEIRVALVEGGKLEESLNIMERIDQGEK